MRVLSLFGFLLVLPLACRTSVVPGALRLRQKIVPPPSWIDQGRAPLTHVILLRIALPQPRFPELEQHLVEISDPLHARYGDHLSKEDVEALVAPHPSSVNAVYQWLATHGIQRDACRQSPAGDWVNVQVHISQAETMLSTVRHCVLSVTLV